MATLAEKIVDFSQRKPREAAIVYAEAMIEVYATWLGEATQVALETGDPQLNVSALRDRLREVDKMHGASAAQDM